MERNAKSATFDATLLEMIRDAVEVGEVIVTLGMARPNKVTWINEDGIWVLTQKSEREGSGPQLVPA